MISPYQRTAPVVAFLLLAAVGAARIVSTYKVFNQTTDEPAHVITGMEWLQKGSYTLEPLHPPLARVSAALGLYLSGVRFVGQTDVWTAGNEILFARGQYLRNLALARAGVLPFFLIAALLVWHWGRTRYGKVPAVIATLLLTTCPPILAHAGLATTDMAATAGFVGALYALVSLMERPSYRQAALFGAITGVATLCKFSVPVFLFAAGISLWFWRWLLKPGKEKATAPIPFRWSIGLALAGVMACLIIWAGYRFSTGSITGVAERPHSKLDGLVGQAGAVHDWAYDIVESRWVPAPAFFNGIRYVRQKEAMGHKGYLLGQTRQTGWWYFFPVALAVKTPIPFLILLSLGLFYLRKYAQAGNEWICTAPAIAAMAVLLICMASRINIGIRHILPIYPLLAIMAGVGACGLWKSVRVPYAGKAIVVVLLAWQCTSSLRIHPDYLAYFNEFAGQHPEKILIDSDLDWGQDLLRLSSTLQQRHVLAVSIAYAGSAKLDLGRFSLPPYRTLAPYQTATGWIAISMLRLKAGGFGLPGDSFFWLSRYRPVELVGRSIYLYYVPGNSGESPSAVIYRPM